jgi:hypothetical protein
VPTRSCSRTEPSGFTWWRQAGGMPPVGRVDRRSAPTTAAARVAGDTASSAKPPPSRRATAPFSHRTSLPAGEGATTPAGSEGSSHRLRADYAAAPRSVAKAVPARPGMRPHGQRGFDACARAPHRAARHHGIHRPSSTMTRMPQSAPLADAACVRRPQLIRPSRALAQPHVTRAATLRR